MAGHVVDCISDRVNIYFYLCVVLWIVCSGQPLTLTRFGGGSSSSGSSECLYSTLKEEGGAGCVRSAVNERRKDFEAGERDS